MKPSLLAVLSLLCLAGCVHTKPARATLRKTGVDGLSFSQRVPAFSYIKDNLPSEIQAAISSLSLHKKDFRLISVSVFPTHLASKEEENEFAAIITYDYSGDK